MRFYKNYVYTFDGRYWRIVGNAPLEIRIKCFKTEIELKKFIDNITRPEKVITP